jgi:hypothetical protein
VAVAQFPSDPSQRPAGRRRKADRDRSIGGHTVSCLAGIFVGSLGDRVIMRRQPVWYG